MLRSTISAVSKGLSGSTSTSRGVAPTSDTASALAMKELWERSPILGTYPEARSASVPDDTPTHVGAEVLSELVLKGLDLLAECDGGGGGDTTHRLEQLGVALVEADDRHGPVAYGGRAENAVR